MRILASYLQVLIFRQYQNLLEIISTRAVSFQFIFPWFPAPLGKWNTRASATYRQGEFTHSQNVRARRAWVLLSWDDVDGGLLWREDCQWFRIKGFCGACPAHILISVAWPHNRTKCKKFDCFFYILSKMNELKQHILYFSVSLCSDRMIKCLVFFDIL